MVSLSPPISPIPIPPSDGDQEIGGISQKGQSLVWFEHLKDFASEIESDSLLKHSGTGETETCIIDRSWKHTLRCCCH